MAQQAVSRLLSLEEFLSLPETEPESELIDGRVEQKPVPRIEHARAQSRLLIALATNPATRDGEALTEQGVNFRGALANHRVPDLVYYRAGRPLPRSGYPEFAPDLGVEVASPGQSRHRLEERLAFLRQHGTACTLLIDPRAKTVAVHDGDRSWLARAGETVVLEQLDRFSFAVDDLFT